MDYKIDTQVVKNILDTADNLDSLITERISELHQMLGGKESRHAFIYYRRLLWDMKYALRDNVEIIRDEEDETYTPNVLKGTKSYRHKENPLEKKLHDKFIDTFGGNFIGLSGIVYGWTDGKQNTPKKYLTNKEETVCVNIIQWLGSPVGQSFLNECGFFKAKDVTNTTNLK